MWLVHLVGIYVLEWCFLIAFIYHSTSFANIPLPVGPLNVTKRSEKQQLPINFLSPSEWIATCYNVPPHHNTAPRNKTTHACQFHCWWTSNREKHTWQAMFVLHRLRQQLMETVLLWTQCHRQMDPLGLSVYKSYSFQIHLLSPYQFRPKPQSFEEWFLTFPILESFFCKMTCCLSASPEGTWKMGALTRLVLKLSIKWRREFTLSRGWFYCGKTSKFHRIGSTVGSRTCGSFAKLIGLLTGPGIELPAISQLSILYSSPVFLNCVPLVFWNCLY